MQGELFLLYEQGNLNKEHGNLILNQPLQSPALWKNGHETTGQAKPAAFEVKFLISQEKAEQVRGWVESKMELDPHADPNSGTYDVDGIYFDTVERDVYFRRPGFARKKYRVRSYARGNLVFLERKAKRRGWVSKRRIPLHSTDPRFWLPDAGEAFDLAKLRPELGWFSQRLQKRKLQPALRIAYERIAYMQLDRLGPIRLTLDRNLRCHRCDGIGEDRNLWFSDGERFQPMLAGHNILELKFIESMPALFRELMSEMGLVSAPLSKYRQAWDHLMPPENQGRIVPGVE